MVLQTVFQDFQARSSSSSLDCVGGGGGFNGLNFMTMIMMTVQVGFNHFQSL